MDNFEKHISNQLQNDKLPFGVNPGIYNRLMYHMQLKASNSAVRKNQLLPSLSVIFATKLIAWKLSVASILLISFMGYNHFRHNTINTPIVDTVQVMHSIDSTNFVLEDSASIN